MTVPTIKVRVVRRPQIKVKALVKFPANVVTQNFLTVTNSGGTYTFSINYSLLTPGPVIDPTTSYVAVQDQTAGIYRTISLSSLLTSGLDADLQAIAALTGTGILVRTAANTWAVRTITAGASIGITNGDGVAGNPTIAVTDPELVAIAGLTSAADSLPYFTGSGTAELATLTTFARTLIDDTTQAAMRTTLGLTPGTDVQAFDSDLAALAANAGTGLWSVTGAGTGSVRTLTAPAAGITVSNGGGVAGNPTLALANDLAALEGLASTGVARRTGTDTWSVGSAVALSELATQAAFTFVGNNTSGTAVPTAVDIHALTLKASPAATDEVIISDQAASGAWKRSPVSSLASASGVSSIAGNTGAFTLSHGLANSTNDIQIDIATQRGLLAGLILSTAGSSATYGVSIGAAVDAASTDFMKLTSAFTKTTSAWAVGTATGSLDTGAIANSTWYHVFLMKRPDTGVVDVLISLSVSAPTMPTNYTLKRRIGSLLTNGSAQWTAFTQVGDNFIWKDNFVDVNVTISGTTAQTAALTVPSGVAVLALFHAHLYTGSGSTNGILLSSLSETDVGPFSLTGGNNASVSNIAGGGYGTGDFEKLTDTSRSIRWRAFASAGSPTFSIYTYGYIDSRGRYS